MKRKKGYFSISAVAHMFGIHPQTIRLYEKQGLICPQRSEGNTRLFSEEDLNRLEEVIYLTHELGINIAGVEIILKLKKQIKRLQKDMNSAFDDTQKELDIFAQGAQESIQKSSRQLLTIKKEVTHNSPQLKDKNLPSTALSDNESDGAWKIDYDE